MKKTIAAVTILVILSLFASSIAFGETYTSGYFEYERLSDGTARIIKYRNYSATTLTIPEKIDGLTVSALAPHILFLSSVAQVSIPKTVKTIEANPFSFCGAGVSVAKDNPYFYVKQGFVLSKKDKRLICYATRTSETKQKVTVPSGTKVIGIEALA